jgi:hypothetical protein
VLSIVVPGTAACMRVNTYLRVEDHTYVPITDTIYRFLRMHVPYEIVHDTVCPTIHDDFFPFSVVKCASAPMMIATGNVEKDIRKKHLQQDHS